jgi:hypothetical protein
VDGFAEQPLVLNGASDLAKQIFGEAGAHARAAVGVNALPLNAAVEVEAVFEVAMDAPGAEAKSAGAASGRAPDAGSAVAD